ncbi:hypothetical protein AB0I53_04985 [Saccharopolyspora sp. NPDC050389]|uniref:hypothetical protein n=1 Tax=Saccharopolyspora sp. NPDC050389 TaxID=3155516 RepID=UPI0033F8D8FA
MTARHDDSVLVVDLRDGEYDAEQAEGAILVLDDAEKAAEHDHFFQALLGNPAVSGVLCVAVDGGSFDGAVRIRPAPSLAPVERAATVWIGHSDGIRWRPADPLVRAVARTDHSGLGQLIDALVDPAVFAAVVKAVNTLPYSTASAGMALERTSLHDAELRRAQEEAIAWFTDPDAGRVGSRELPREEFRAAVGETIEVDSSEDVLAPGAELAEAHARAVTALNAADHALTRVDHFLAPFPKRRPRPAVGPVLAEARAAAQDFHDKATQQLHRIDENLRGQRVGRDVVTRLGVRGPAPARPRDIRDRSRRLVEEWLGRYRSVACLLPDLDAGRVGQEPQGCAAAIAELADLAAPAGSAPRLASWPSPALAAPLAAVAGGLAALGTFALGIVAAFFVPVLAMAWFAAGLLLQARQPTTTGEQGFADAAPPAALFWALPVLGGWLLVFLVAGTGIPDVLGAVAVLLSVLLSAWTIGVGWRRSVRHWRRELDFDDARDRVARTAQLVDEVIRAEWRPSARRALFAEGLRQVSIGLTAVRDVLAERAADLLGSPGQPGENGSDRPPDRDVHQEACEVVVTDLVDLTIAALRPCWAGIEADRPAAREEHEREVERLLAAYREHLGRYGLLVPPPFARDRAHRAELAARLWDGSLVGDALRCDVDAEMTQLCHARQLGAVSAMADRAQLVRFAPAAVRGGRHGDPGLAVTWTGEAEIAGTLRLVPLRQGVFQ